MNIVKRELRAHLKSFIIWNVCIFLFIISMTSEFSAYYDNPDMAEVIEMMPQQLLDAFSMSAANLTTVSGYFSIASVYFVLLLGIYAGLLGASIIAKEERDKTAEFFMTLPISRYRAITAKLIAAVLLCLAMDVSMIGQLYAVTTQYDKMADFNTFMWLMFVSQFIVMMIFMSIGMLLSSVMKRYKKSGSYSMGLLMFLYFVSIAIGFKKELENLKYITPFKYFEPSVYLRELELDPVYIFISLGIILVSLLVTYVVYPRRDLHI